jgi:hypothetical protein
MEDQPIARPLHRMRQSNTGNCEHMSRPQVGFESRVPVFQVDVGVVMMCSVMVGYQHFGGPCCFNP